MKKLLALSIGLSVFPVLAALPAMASDAAISRFVRERLKVHPGDREIADILLKDDAQVVQGAYLYCTFLQKGDSVFDAIWSVASLPDVTALPGIRLYDESNSENFNETVRFIDSRIKRLAVLYAIGKDCKL